MDIVPNGVPEQVFSFIRANGRDAVFAAMNFSEQPATVRFESARHHGAYRDYFSGDSVVFDADSSLLFLVTPLMAVSKAVDRA